jgi:chorismate mutase-like protein
VMDRKIAKNDHEDVRSLRRKIDRLDAQLVRLMNRRMEVALRIGSLKKAEGEPIYDPSRERQVLIRVAELNRGPLPPATLRDIFRRIVTACRRRQASAAAREGSGATH